MKDQFNNIFISYAREDLAVANRIFQNLEKNGYSPWLDTEKILAGEEWWDTVIKPNLKRANFALVIISETSINKRGVFQRELRQIMRKAEDTLISDIYLIPIKIDDCVMPEQLEKFQWLDYRTDQDLRQLKKSLDKQIQIFENQKWKITTNKLNHSYEYYNKHKYISDPVKIDIKLRYPQFEAEITNSLGMINAFILSEIGDEQHSILNILSTSSSLIPTEVVDNCVEYSLEVEYIIEFQNKNLVSLSCFVHAFYGGAHGLYGTRGRVYLLSPHLRKINILSIFDSNDSTLSILFDILIQKIKYKFLNDYNLSKEMVSEITQVVKMEWTTFKNFYVKKGSLVFIFNPYEIASFAIGQIDIEIFFNELLEAEPNLNSLKYLIELQK